MDNKDEIIKKLVDENEYLKGLLKANNILYVAKKYVEDIKLSTSEKLNLYQEYFAFRKSPIRKISFYNEKYYSFIVCNNFYKNNLCNKINNSKYDCLKCQNQDFVSFDEHELIRHLKGEIAYSGYLNLPNDETKLLALLIKDIDYKYIATAFKKVAYSYGIEVTFLKGLEENEIYIYIFFEIAVKLTIARKVDQFLLDEMFNKSNLKLNLSLYNSLIPNSDYESNNIGSIVPFPLSMMLNKSGETLMLDENFLPYKNQFAYLKTVQKVDISKINYIISKLNEVNKNDNKGLFKNFCLKENDFPKTMTVYIKNMIEVPIDGVSERAINFLKRLGSVINSKYYENQRRRLSVYNEAKYIILYEDNNPLYLKLPIGALDNLKVTFNKAKVNYEIKNLREEGDKINVTFKGKLKPEQELAFQEIINYDNGIINAPTGFGKTVLAIYLISYFKVNTLILVNKQTLLNQWLEKLEEFLDVGYEYEKVKFGSYYSAKKKLTNKIDVASILSFSNDEESKKILSSYGLVIIDEVHHLAANKYNLVAKEINARRVYGFTATPIRSDGNMAAVFKLIGEVRYIAKNSDSTLIKKMTPIYTDFVYDQVISNLNYNDTIDKLIHDENRNKLIVTNIIKAINEKKNILVLSERIEHLEIIYDMLKDISYPKYFITGQMKLKERKIALESLAKEENNFILFSTGQISGEGFDEPRLNTLFLISPFKWDGKLKQYIGRLERRYPDKSIINVYDVSDIKCGVFLNMFYKRNKGYIANGYLIDDIKGDDRSHLFTYLDYKYKFMDDISLAKRKILFISLYFDSDYLINLLKGKNLNITLISKLKIDNIPLEVTNYIYSDNVQANLVIIDDSIIYYGDINPLIKFNSLGTILRINDSSYVKELLKSLNID